METNEYLEYLRRDGAALAAAARRMPDAHIGSCPEWDMTDLVAHVGGVHRWVNDLVTTKAAKYIPRQPVELDGFEATLAWYEDGLSTLLATLGAVDPEEPVWNWADRKPAPARFWIRRMAHETAIHRWDSEAAHVHGGEITETVDAHEAHEHDEHDHHDHDHEGDEHGGVAGHPDPIATDLAVDGIDEYLGFVGLWLSYQPVPGLEGSLHLHATDTAGEWSMVLTPDHMEYRQEHVKSDVAIRAPASDLLLWLLNRVAVDSPSFKVFGESEIVELWRQLQF